MKMNSLELLNKAGYNIVKSGKHVLFLKTGTKKGYRTDLDHAEYIIEEILEKKKISPVTFVRVIDIIQVLPYIKLFTENIEVRFDGEYIELFNSDLRTGFEFDYPSRVFDREEILRGVNIVMDGYMYFY